MNAYSKPTFLTLYAKNEGVRELFVEFMNEPALSNSFTMRKLANWVRCVRGNKG